MPTNNPRINITFEPETAQILSALAKQENKSLSGIALELIKDALERREDMVLSAIAEKLDNDKQTTISHVDAWK